MKIGAFWKKHKRKLYVAGSIIVVGVLLFLFGIASALSGKSPQQLTRRHPGPFWYEDCLGAPDCVTPYPTEPRPPPEWTPTCLPTPSCPPGTIPEEENVTPSPWPTATKYPPQPTFGPPTNTPVATATKPPPPTPTNTPAPTGDPPPTLTPTPGQSPLPTPTATPPLPTPTPPESPLTPP